MDPHFGGDEALIQLSNALHENGMKLILDSKNINYSLRDIKENNPKLAKVIMSQFQTNHYK